MAETKSGLTPTNKTLPFVFVGTAPDPRTDPIGYRNWDNAKRNYDRMKASYEDYLARAQNMAQSPYAGDHASAQQWLDKAQQSLTDIQEFVKRPDFAKFFQPSSGTVDAGTGAAGSAAPQIPFKAGLSDAQKQGITTLAQKPVAQWTATDKANWNYATNNAPLPTQSAGTGTTPTQASTTSSTSAQGQPAASGLKFYRVGQDIYDAATGRKLGPTEWNSTWSGKAQEVSAPATPGQPASGAGTGAGTGAGSAAGPSIGDQRKTLTDAGIDVSGLNDQQVSYLAAFKSMMDTKAKNDQSVLPKQLTADEMGKFMEDAKKEMDPYYAEQLRIGQKDLLNTFADITQDTAFQSKQRESAIQEEQKAQAESMAEAGLTYSGIRKEAEQKLKDQEQGIVRSEASIIGRKLREQAGQFEKTYGSAALSRLNIPALSYAGVQVKPYDAYGGLLGTQGKEQITNETQRQQELAKNELEKRYGLGFGVQPSF